MITHNFILYLFYINSTKTERMHSTIKRIVVFIIFMSCLTAVKADTIHKSYHVYYNKILVKSNLDTVTQIIPLHFKYSDILITDSLFINYLETKSCDSCKYFLVVIDSHKNYVKVLSNQGQKNSFAVSVFDIKLWADKNKINMFEIYYYKEKPAFPVHLLKIVLD